MKHDITSRTGAPANTALPICETQVAVVLEQHCFLLNDGRLARQAISCLITPEVGDRVLAITSQDDNAYILHILQRQNLEQAMLSVPGVDRLAVQQNQINLYAKDQLQLNALRDVEINAATGVMRINAHSLFTTVTESMVQNARNFVGLAEHYLVEVKLLLRLHSQQALITAEKDVKIDGERISMG